MKHNGYFLIETLIACILLATITCLIFIYRNPCEQNHLRHELQMLQASLHYLQQKAIAQNKVLDITFSTSRNEYFYKEGKTYVAHRLTKPVSFGFIQGAKGPPSRPTSKLKTPFSFEGQRGQTLYAFPNGKLSSGTIYFTNLEKTIMGALTIPPHQYAHIRLYEYKRNTWHLLSDKELQGFIS